MTEQQPERTAETPRKDGAEQASPGHETAVPPAPAAPASPAPARAGKGERIRGALRRPAAHVLAAGVLGGLVGGGAVAGAVALLHDGHDRRTSVSRQAEPQGPGGLHRRHERYGFPGGPDRSGRKRQWPGLREQREQQDGQEREQPSQTPGTGRDATPTPTPTPGA